MDKQKQIEEMAYELTQYEYKLCGRLPKNECLLTSHIHAQVCCDYCKIAEYLIEQGYRKIPENAVVLTREELHDKGYRKVCEPEIINGEVVGFVVKDGYVPSSIIEFVKHTTRKETAEKYHAEINKAIESVPNATKEFVQALKAKNDEICKEITEGKVYKAYRFNCLVLHRCLSAWCRTWREQKTPREEYKTTDGC